MPVGDISTSRANRALDAANFFLADVRIPGRQWDGKYHPAAGARGINRSTSVRRDSDARQAHLRIREQPNCRIGGLAL